MKKISTLLILVIVQFAAFACPVCERNKAKFLQGITHGGNPESNWDYVIVIGIGIIVLLTLVYSVKFFVWPNEKNADHIKYSFINEH